MNEQPHYEEAGAAPSGQAIEVERALRPGESRVARSLLDSAGDVPHQHPGIGDGHLQG